MICKDIKRYAETRRKLRETLKVESDDDYSVILWQPTRTPPEDASYVLVKTLEQDGQTIVCSPAAYEKEQFLYFFYDGTVKILDKRSILGWSYYPFDDRAFLPGWVQE